jgi:hypothetical protein
MQYLIWLSFSEYEDGWKLNWLDAGDWGIEGMNGRAIMQKASGYVKSRQYLSAHVYVTIASRIIKPARRLQYPDENELLAIQEEITDSVNANLELPLRIMNRFVVFGIDKIVAIQGVSPLIHYVTNTPLESTPLRKEADIILSQIVKLYPDVKKNFGYVVFKAYNEIPSGQKERYQVFTTVVELGKKGAVAGL